MIAVTLIVEIVSDVVVFEMLPSITIPDEISATLLELTFRRATAKTELEIIDAEIAKNETIAMIMPIDL